MADSEFPDENISPETQQPLKPPVNDLPVQSAPATGRQALRALRRQLSDEELQHPGTIKMLLDALDRAEADCEVLRGYIERFHDSDKRAAILEQRLKAVTATDIYFAVGLAGGGGILGLAPFFWDVGAKYGIVCILIGFFLLVGSAVARLKKE